MSGLTNHMNFAISFFVGGVTFLAMLLVKIPFKMLTAKIAAKRFPDHSDRFAGGGEERPVGHEEERPVGHEERQDGYEKERLAGYEGERPAGHEERQDGYEKERLAGYRRWRKESIRIYRRRLNFFIIIITFVLAIIAYGLMLNLFHEEHFKLCYALKGGCMAISLYAVFEQFFGSVE